METRQSIRNQEGREGRTGREQASIENWAGLRIAQLAATFRAWHVASPQRPSATLERVAKQR